jgi:hypothetical protein
MPRAASNGMELEYDTLMGHDLPPQVWPQVIGEISELAGNA